jgi:hypothetical protein
MLISPKKIGDKAYAKFLTACLFKDWVVLEPNGDCDRYDCVIDSGNAFERVQVKNRQNKKRYSRLFNC